MVAAATAAAAARKINHRSYRAAFISNSPGVISLWGYLCLFVFFSTYMRSFPSNPAITDERKATNKNDFGSRKDLQVTSLIAASSLFLWSSGFDSGMNLGQQTTILVVYIYI